jgi:O-antigen/teichoic acid export membrane protein
MAVFRDSIGLCLALFIQSVVNQINSNVDKTLIGIFMNPETVTLYGIGLYVFNVFSSLTSVPITMFAPQIVREVDSNGIQAGLHEKNLQATKIITLIGGTVFFGFVSVGRPFVEIVYGGQYMDAWLIAVILMSSAFLNMMVGSLNNVLDALNKRMFRSLMILATTVLNLILTLVWLPRYGIIGAAVATMLCTVLGQVILMGIYYTAHLKIRLLDLYWQAFKSIIVYQIAAMAVAMVISTQFASALFSLLVGMGTYMLVFGILYLTLSADGRKYFHIFMKRIR